MMRLRFACIGLALVASGCIITDPDGDTDGATSGAATDSATSPSTTASATVGTTAGTTTATTAATGAVDESGTADSAPETSASSTGDGSANARCDDLCDALVGAACDGGLTSEGCLLTCRSLTSSDQCDDLGNTYFDCVLDTTVTCDAAGDPVAEGCGLAYLEAIGCAVNADPNPDIVEPCMQHCSTVAEAACENNAQESECNTNCLWLGNTGAGCDEEWAGYLSCFDEATVSCFLGFAVGEGCGPAFATYSECANAAGE